MKPVRLGFIGAGEMANWSVLPALHFAPVELVSICDLVEERARESARKFGAGTWYRDYRSMWEKEDLEAVVIHMHPSPRQSIVLDALEAGLHVFVPKPPSPSLPACRELADAAEAAGKVVMVNFQRRFSFGVRQARSLMADQDFGRLSQLSCSFCSGHYDALRMQHYESRLHAYFLDFSVHHLDLARYLGGEIRNFCFFANQFGGIPSCAVALEFTSGAVGTLQLNSQRIWWRNYDRIELTGEGRYIVLDGLWSVRYYAPSANSFTENYSDERSGELTGDAFALIEFARSIREGREPIASIQDCVETMKLYQALYDAVLGGRQGEIIRP